MSRPRNTKSRDSDDVIIHRRGSKVVTIRRTRPIKITPAADLMKLLRQYAEQARRNFTTEAVLFAVIVIVAVAWPAVHTLQLLAEIR